MKNYSIILLLFISHLCSGQIFSTVGGKVHFISDAPLELIEAESVQMQGLINIEKQTFAFKIYIKSFEGFNSPLQQVHFYENYMEANEFPIATFKGKILEPIHKGKDIYRAKGMLNLHGKSLERIFEVKLDIKDKSITYSSAFEVPLVDHNIDLPQIVYQKIAENIKVTVQGEMILKE